MSIPLCMTTFLLFPPLDQVHHAVEKKFLFVSTCQTHAAFAVFALVLFSLVQFLNTFAHRSYSKQGILLSLKHSCAWIRIIIPWRFRLPPFSDTLCDSFAVESCTWRKSIEVHQLSRHTYMPRSNCRLFQRCLPAGVYDCVYLTHRTTGVSEDGWASLNPRRGVTHQIPNRLCCPVDNILRSVSPCNVDITEGSRDTGRKWSQSNKNHYNAPTDS